MITLSVKDPLKNEKFLIQVIIREKTDLVKLYDRMELLGNFSKYPSKFKESFLKYCKTLQDEAKSIMMDNMMGELNQNEMMTEFAMPY